MPADEKPAAVAAAVTSDSGEERSSSSSSAVKKRVTIFENKMVSDDNNNNNNNSSSSNNIVEAKKVKIDLRSAGKPASSEAGVVGGGGKLPSPTFKVCILSPFCANGGLPYMMSAKLLDYWTTFAKSTYCL